MSAGVVRHPEVTLQARRSPADSDLTPPPLCADHVARPALVDRIERGTPGKLTVVAAPAGSGKTQALVEWYEAHRGARSWLTLPDDPGSAVSFVSHLAASLRPVVPSLGAAPAEPDDRPVPERLAGLLAAVRSSAGSLVSVIDGYERVTRAEVNVLMRSLLNQLPPNWRLVLASRETPDVGRSRLRVESVLTEIGLRELCFTVQETWEYLAQAHDERVADAAAETVMQSTDGWVAAIRLAAELAQAAPDPIHALRSFTCRHPAVVDHVRENIAASLAPLEREFVVLMSVTETFEPGLCGAITQDRRAAAVLATLGERATFFERSGYGSTERSVFAGPLAEPLSELIGGDADVARQRAVAWYLDRGRHGTAVVTLLSSLSSNPMARAASLVRSEADRITDEMSLRQLTLCVRALRSIGSDHLPLELLLLGAFAATETGAIEASRFIASVHRRITSIEDPDAADAAALAADWIELRWMLRSGRPEQSLRMADCLESWLKTSAPQTTGPWRGTGRVASTVARAYWLAGLTDDAVRVLGDHLEANASAGAVLEGFGLWAMIEVQQGRSAHGARLAETALGDRAESIVFGRGGEYADLALRWSAGNGVPVVGKQSAARRERLANLCDLACLQLVIEADVALRSGAAETASAALGEARRIASELSWAGLRRVIERQAGAVGDGDQTLRHLSRRELEVLELLPSSLTQRAIAERLSVSINTVKVHIRNIYRKLHVSGRDAAMQRAIQLGLLGGSGGFSDRVTDL